MASRLSFLSTTGLIRSDSSATLAPSPTPTQASSGSTKPRKTIRTHKRTPNGPKSKTTSVVAARFKKFCGDNGVVPLGSLFIVGIAIVISLFFIAAVSFAFIGAEEELPFKDTLNDLAENSPGVRLSIALRPQILTMTDVRRFC